MENLYNRRRIADEVYFTSITDTKFKVNRISVQFITELSDKAAENAVVSSLLVNCNNKLNTLEKLNRKLAELYSANLNFSVRANSDYQVCEISAAVLDNRFAINGEDLIKEVVNILIDCIFDPYFEDGHFPAGSLEIEKQNQIDDNNAEINDKTNYAFLKGFEEAFRGEPAEIRWGGTNEQVSAIDAQSALKAYKRMISELRAEVICVGENSFDGIAELFADAFGKIVRHPETLNKARFSLNKNEVSRITETLDIEQSKLVMFFKTADRYREKYPLIVMQYLYGGTESSKLFTVVREKMSLCYYCYSRSGYSKGYVTAECGVDEKNLEAAEKECIAQLKAIADGDFTDTEVEKVRLSLINMLRSTGDSVTGISSKCINDILFPDHADSVDNIVEQIKGVTREQIIEAAKALRLDTVFMLRSERSTEKE